jgi:myosin V
MAENIYSKGTRVWFEDKDQAWISAEVSNVTKGSDDAIKLVFIDERGKASLLFTLESRSCLHIILESRR